jgi:hypothetical protein
MRAVIGNVDGVAEGGLRRTRERDLCQSVIKKSFEFAPRKRIANHGSE